MSTPEHEWVGGVNLEYGRRLAIEPLSNPMPY